MVCPSCVIMTQNGDYHGMIGVQHEVRMVKMQLNSPRFGCNNEAQIERGLFDHNELSLNRLPGKAFLKNV